MASDAPDPSSSELLTDFDIADVDNWDDENDSSKVGLLKKSLGSLASKCSFKYSNNMSQKSSSVLSFKA